MSFMKHIMPKDKYSKTLLKSDGGFCVYYSSNISAAGTVLKIGGIFSHIVQF